MFDFVLLLSTATIIAILLIMGYLGYYAYRHIQDDSRAHPETAAGRKDPMP
ncbi:hypothetical protein QWI17_17900 [Gilvimarinus sp. SDUM040013]|uniref:DUF3149 domain-containing protein n=1 Tax=Gilvimarinus gilvus TaxID=3058038 RepID=A0ABU4RXC6_9GAMM|nr:hypothetical protein [Gilvimarinus sp. SDUM040013]MDO3387722.1 hypothetical protein [Gilvimarinus sp. SDUM040013]MDX6848837.1 hypothetical protein [Gilvimarinus sp. SDUM040013]